jgi:hypothetical protein
MQCYYLPHLSMGRSLEHPDVTVLDKILDMESIKQSIGICTRLLVKSFQNNVSKWASIFTQEEMHPMFSVPISFLLMPLQPTTLWQDQYYYVTLQTVVHNTATTHSVSQKRCEQQVHFLSVHLLIRQLFSFPKQMMLFGNCDWVAVSSFIHVCSS